MNNFASYYFVITVQLRQLSKITVSLFPPCLFVNNVTSQVRFISLIELKLMLFTLTETLDIPQVSNKLFILTSQGFSHVVRLMSRVN